MLDMSRIISGKMRLDVQPVDLQDVVKTVVASVRHSAEAKDLGVQTVLDPKAGPVRGDPDRLQQCLWNLLSNAIKFTPKGGKIQVAVERAQSSVQISVTDTGEGISAEFLPHVFERFRQADASLTRRYRGLGLGLSIVKHLVELHGGSVQAQSPGKGRGATFVIELPVFVVQPEASELGLQQPARPAHSLSWLDQPSLEGISV